MAATTLQHPSAGGLAHRRLAPHPAAARLRAAAACARERLCELDGVRVLAPEPAPGAFADRVRLVIDLRDTGRGAWAVAEAMAARGLALEPAGEHVLTADLGEAELEEGDHERLAPALLIALWSTPPAPRSPVGGLRLCAPLRP
jgi:hypothetical protein